MKPTVVFPLPIKSSLDLINDECWPTMTAPPPVTLLKKSGTIRGTKICPHSLTPVWLIPTTRPLN